VSDRDAFVARYGPLFEHSPWVAEAAWDEGPFADDDALLAAMVGAVARAPRERRLALIRAHPDLAGRAAIAGELTADSAREQAAAGLDRLTPEEYARFTTTNAAYRERHGFPFVICAREHDKASILGAAAERFDNDTETEVDVALGEIAKIARLRLEDLP
jgi:2-oxo-4-hydroxy-4-carboxy-5-ureidoimidazoline decarboxylase